MSVKIFVVMAPPELPDAGPDPEWQAENMVFVKDGFSLAALVIPVLWLVWQRMWLPLLAYLAYLVAISTIEMSFGLLISGIISFACKVLFALEANSLRRWSLGAKGWRTVGEAVGRNRNEAEFLFFRDLANQPARDGQGNEKTGREAAPAMRPAATRPATPRPDDEPEIFGLFPEAER